MIDFQEDKEIDFQAESQSLSANNIDFQPAQVLQGKVEQNVQLSPYDTVMKDKSLTKEQKVQKIKEIGEAERKNIDKEHRKTMAKLYAGAALEIGSAAIPFGGAAKLGGTLALKLAKPAFSQIAKKAIVKNIGSGIASGLASGAMFGAGEGLMENKDLKGTVKSTAQGAGTGALGGGLIGGVTGKIATKLGKTKDVINKVQTRTNRLEHAEQVAKEGFNNAENMVRELIQNRRANIDTSKFEAMQKINKFSAQIDDIANELNLDPKGLREVLPFIRENTDLPVQNFNRPDLAKIFNGLNQDQKEVLRMVAQNHFDDMETYWNNLAKIKNTKSSMSPDEYITHIWDLDDNQKAAVKAYYGNLKTKSQFEKARKIPTYKEGIEYGLDIPMGKGQEMHIDLRPKTLDYAEIQKIHSHQLIDAAENAKFMKELKKIQKANPDYAKELEEIARPVLEATNEPEAAKGLAGKLLQKAGNAYDTVNNFAKGCKFLFNGMHVVALTESAAAHEGIVPFKTFKTLGNLPKIIDGIKNNNFEVFKDNPAVKRAIQDGVQFGAISDINIGEFNTFIDGVSNLVDKVTFGASKIVTKPMRAYIDINNKFLWNYLHNTYKLHAYETLIDRVSKKGKIVLSDNVRKDIGQLVNDTFGGQNWDALGIKPGTVKAARRLLLSPDWNMSATVRQSLAIFSSEAGQKFLNEFAKSSKFGSATRELSRKLGLSSFTNDIEGAGVRGEQARKYFMTFLIQTAIYSNIINACNRVIDKHNNPEKYESGINYSSYSNNRFTEKDGTGKKVVDTLFTRPYIGNDENGRELYARVGKQALEVPEIVEDMPNSAIRKAASKTAPLINPVVTKISDEVTDNWNKASIGDRYKDTFTPFTVSGSRNGFRPINMFYSTSKGLNAYKAREYLKECLLKGDMEAIEKFKPKMKANKIDFDRQMYRVYKELEQEDYGNRRN
jgi:hypothetical protein